MRGSGYNVNQTPPCSGSIIHTYTDTGLCQHGRYCCTVMFYEGEYNFENIIEQVSVNQVKIKLYPF